MAVVSAEPRLGLACADPKPAKRYRATPAEWEYMRGILLVEPCAICGGRSESLHHIYGRGQRGSDVLSNLAPVCGDGTRGCHGLLTARNPEALRALGHWIGAAFITYLASVLGDTDRAWAWIDRNLLLSERGTASMVSPGDDGKQTGHTQRPASALRGIVFVPRSENSKSAAPSSPPAPQGAAESGAESQALSAASAPTLLARALGPGERLVNGDVRYSSKWL